MSKGSQFVQVLTMTIIRFQKPPKKFWSRIIQTRKKYISPIQISTATDMIQEMWSRTKSESRSYDSPNRYESLIHQQSRHEPMKPIPIHDFIFNCNQEQIPELFVVTNKQEGLRCLQSPTKCEIYRVNPIKGK